jgi:hypothetical protein
MIGRFGEVLRRQMRVPGVEQKIRAWRGRILPSRKVTADRAPA